jgi:ankyrin repeat protein
MDAIMIGDVAEVQRILASGVNLEEKDSEGDTALYWAMIYRREPIVGMLLAAGASLLALSASRSQALITACSHNSMACIQACLAQGADINYAQPLTGKTPLMAVIRSYHPIATAEFLISKGANVSAIDAKGWNAVMWAAHLRGDEAAWMTLLLAGTVLQPRIKESDAATTIQSLWRGIQVRKVISSLKVYARMRSAHTMKLSVAPRGSIGYTLFREQNKIMEAFSPLSIE